MAGVFHHRLRNETAAADQYILSVEIVQRLLIFVADTGYAITLVTIAA